MSPVTELHSILFPSNSPIANLASRNGCFRPNYGRISINYDGFPFLTAHMRSGGWKCGIGHHSPVDLAWSFCDSGATAFVSNDY